MVFSVWGTSVTSAGEAEAMDTPKGTPLPSTTTMSYDFRRIANGDYLKCVGVQIFPGDALDVFGTHRHDLGRVGVPIVGRQTVEQARDLEVEHPRRLLQ